MFINHFRLVLLQFTKFAGPGQWSKVGIALVNSGAIRSSIDERARNGSHFVEQIGTDIFNNPPFSLNHQDPSLTEIC